MRKINRQAEKRFKRKLREKGKGREGNSKRNRIIRADQLFKLHNLSLNSSASIFIFNF